MWVRFPSPALCASGSVGGARPCQGRGRGFESRLALSKKHKKMVSNRIPSFLCFRAPPGLEGSRSPLRSGRCETNVHRTFRNVSRSDKQEGTCGYYFCISNPAGLEGSRSPFRFGRCKANVHRMFCSLRSASVVAKRTSTGRSATSRALKETRKNSENTQRILRVFVTRTKILQRKTKCFAY